ncbi:hypothetical protein V8C86DRAFT_2749093 [Haematococcus lacustris]
MIEIAAAAPAADRVAVGCGARDTVLEEVTRAAVPSLLGPAKEGWGGQGSTSIGRLAFVEVLSGESGGGASEDLVGGGCSCARGRASVWGTMARLSGGKGGAEGSMEGAEGSMEGAEGSREGAEGSREGAEGSREGAEGSREGAWGSREGAEGSREGAEGFREVRSGRLLLVA